MFLLLCLILLGATFSALFPLQSRLLEIAKQLKNTKEQTESLEEQLRTGFAQRANALDQLKVEGDKAIREQLAKANGEIDEALKPVIAKAKEPADAQAMIVRLAELQHAIQGAAERRYSKIDALTEWSANVADKAKQTQKALELAQKARTDGQLDLAKIYYVSAISHSPDDASILSAYADAVFASKPSAEDLARLRSITQVAMYQISPEQIPKALAILAKTTPGEVSQASQPGKIVPKSDWVGKLRDLTRVPLDMIFSDPAKLQARMDGLAEIADALTDQPSPNGDLEKQLTADFRKTEQTLAATKTTALLDQYLANLTASADKDPIKAVSIVQAAESVMAQLWGLDLGGLPGPLQKKIDAYPLRLKAGVDRIAEVKSAPFLAEIQKQMQRAKGVSSESNGPQIGMPGPLQTACDTYEDCFTKAQQAYAQVSSETLRKQLEPQLTAMRDFVISMKKKQFDAYQKWAVGEITRPFEAYDKSHWATDSDIMQFFDSYNIAKIDQNSLAPDTARMFNEVVGKFLSQLNSAEKVVKCERKMANAQKIKLENF